MYTFAKLLTSNELDKFYESIGTMPYRERRQRLWRATNPRQSRFLYKYHSFDGPYSIVNLRSAIVDGVLRLSRAADFNDIEYNSTWRLAVRLGDATAVARRDSGSEELRIAGLVVLVVLRPVVFSLHHAQAHD
jgi:hypothetical protein